MVLAVPRRPRQPDAGGGPRDRGFPHAERRRELPGGVVARAARGRCRGRDPPSERDRRLRPDEPAGGGVSTAPAEHSTSTGSLEGLSAGLERDLLARVVTAQRSWRAPGVSVGVVRDGRLVWSAHVGSARLGPAATPADDDTQFMIGSVTKTFTALAVMSLRDEGLLSLDDTLETYLPETRHARVPLRQMLAHASGLQREPVGNIWESLDAPERDAFVSGVEQAEQVLPPHHAFHYSNLAYGLLGEVVQRV